MMPAVIHHPLQHHFCTPVRDATTRERDCAIADLYFVRFIMDEAGDCASAFLRMLLASLVSVSLSFPSDPMISSYSPMWSFYDYDATTFLNPIWSLDRSTESLKVLEGSGFSLLRTDPPHCDVVYPHVWKVRASFKYGTWERMAVVYAHAFPNLKHLVLNKHTGMRRYVYNPRLIQPGGWAEALRQGNREDQLKCGSWKSLCVVEGTLKAVYSLGLVLYELAVWLPLRKVLDRTNANLSNVAPHIRRLSLENTDSYDVPFRMGNIYSKAVQRCINIERAETEHTLSILTEAIDTLKKCVI